jgi:hypothetical protein
MKKRTLLTLTIMLLAVFIPAASAQTTFVTATASSGCTTQMYFEAGVSVYWICTVTGFPPLNYSPVLATAGIKGLCTYSGTLATGYWNWEPSGSSFGRQTPGYIWAEVTGATEYGTVDTWERCGPAGQQTCVDSLPQLLLC